MLSILLVIANVFEHFRIGSQLKPDIFSPWLGVSLGVIDGDLNAQMPEVGACEALGDMHRVAVGMTCVIQPAPVVESSGIDNQRVSLPLTSRITIPGRQRDFGTAAAIHENLPKVSHLLVKDSDDVRSLNDPFWPTVHKCIRDGVRQTIPGGSAHALRIHSFFVESLCPGLER